MAQLVAHLLGEPKYGGLKHLGLDEYFQNEKWLQQGMFQ
jgi:hypothetical protein